MAIVITLAGQDLTNQIESDSFSIVQNITSEVDTASMVYNKYGDRTYLPAVGDEIVVTDAGVKTFAGVLVEYDQSAPDRNTIRYTLKFKDYTHLLDRKKVTETYENMDMADIVRDIVDNFSVGFTHTGVVDASQPIEFIQFNYTTPSDAIRDLAQMIGFDWYVDYDRVVHFFPQGARVAPFQLRDTNNTYITSSLKLTKSIKQLRNVIYVIGSDYVGGTIRDEVGNWDGNRKRFNLYYKYDSLPTIYVNNVAVPNVGIENLDAPGTHDAYYNYSEKIIVFDDSFTATNGDIVEVEGEPLYPLFVKLTAPNTDLGEYEHKITDKTLKSEDAVRKRAMAEIEAYSDNIADASFKTYRPGLMPGQQIVVNSMIQGITNEKYIIQRVQITMNGPLEFRYAITLASTRAYKAVEFFRGLIRTGEKEIAATRNPSEILNIIGSFEETVAIEEDYMLQKYLKRLADQIQFSEDLLARKDHQHTWVWGNYPVQDINDTQRTPNWDGGGTWG